MRRALLAALACLCASPWADASERLPRFPKDMPYEQVRAGMIALGWKPTPYHEGYYECHPAREDMCRKDWPEVYQCWPTGAGWCLTMWRRGDTLVQVKTQQESPATYVNTTCRANC